MEAQGGSVWFELAREAVSGLRTQGRRSLLALLGVMIGSASIVALLTFSHIARTEALSRFQQLGVDMVQIYSDRGVLDEDELERALAGDPAILQTAPLVVGRETLRMGRHSTSVSVAALSPEAMDMLLQAVRGGRNLTALDGCNGVAVMGDKLARDTGAVVGDTAFIGSYGFYLVGVLGPQDPQALNPVTADETVFIGLPCARRVMTHAGISHALIRLDNRADMGAWAETMRHRLQASGEATKLKTPLEMIAAMNSQMNLMSAILVAIGSVSLLVGGVGVMNVMLMSVMERRKEIGLRAAIGATPGEIVFIFVVEAVVLSVGGGLAGAVGGVGLAALGCLFLPISFAFDPMVIVWGTLVAGCVGLVFGIHPALAASRILPVEALRAD